MAQSKQISVATFLTRADNRCKNVKDYKTDKKSIVVLGQFVTLNTFSAANSALRKFFTRYVQASVTTSSVDGTCKAISTSNYKIFDVVALGAGMTKPYIESENMKHFMEIQTATAHEQKSGRYYYWMPDLDEILLFNGANISPADSSVNLSYVAYPDVTTISEDNWTTDSVKMPLPDFILGYASMMLSIEAIKEQGLNVPESFGADLERSIAAVASRLTQDEITAMKLNQDNPTK